VSELNHDPFLDSFNEFERARILCAFVDAYRSGRLTPAAGSDPRTAGTCQDALASVVSAYRFNLRANPTKDIAGIVDEFFRKQIKGYHNLDPAPQGQKACTPSILRKIIETEESPLDLAVSQLLTGAFFFAMRSCEYLKVRGERRTKLLRLRNFQFFRGNCRLNYNDPALVLADSVAITFEFQKNDQRNEVIVHHRCSDPQLCPVRAWASILIRIISYPGTTMETTVNMYLPKAGGKLKAVVSEDACKRLRRAAASIGSARLGFEPHEMGTHSIRSGAAMAMYLAGVPTFTIMLIGRWSSDAFLLYIRKQVREFSRGIAPRMLLTDEYFSVASVTNDDPRVPGNANNFSGHGLPTGLTNQTRAAQPAFALHL
jgi:hypothetical protein